MRKIRRITKRHRKTRKKGGKLGSCINSNSYNKGNPLQVNSSTWFLHYDKNNPNIIIKEIGPSVWLDDDTIKAELDTSRRASELNIGPKVHYTCFDDKNKIGYLVMDRIDGVTIDRILETANNSVKNKILAKAQELFNKLYENGIYHRDIHAGNLMWGRTQSDKTQRLWIIDFGMIENLNENSRQEEPPTITYRNIS